jgi:hypothetical protein
MSYGNLGDGIQALLWLAVLGLVALLGGVGWLLWWLFTNVTLTIK